MTCARRHESLRASLGKAAPKGVRRQPGVVIPSPGAWSCGVLGPCGCPKGAGCGRRAREPALAQTMIQPTGRIISEELLDTMRKTFPNKAFSPPPASLPQPRLLLGSNLQAPVTTKVRCFCFPLSQGEHSWGTAGSGFHPGPREQQRSCQQSPQPCPVTASNLRAANFRSWIHPKYTSQAS